jgi:hypothetical protein
MRFTIIAALIAATATGALLTAPANAAPQKKRVAYMDARGHTVFTSRDEDGRRRTRIIIQRRSYLDPGTEVFRGENSDHRYAFSPSQRPESVLDNTAFGRSQSPLPGPFTLPGHNGSSLQF